MYRVAITLYTKAGCCLCDEALEVLERVRETTEFDLHVVDITSDAQLERAYFDRIPVVEVNGTVEFEYLVDEFRLSELLNETARKNDKSQRNNR